MCAWLQKIISVFSMLISEKRALESVPGPGSTRICELICDYTLPPPEPRKASCTIFTEEGLNIYNN